MTSALAHFNVRPSYATDTATATALVARIVADAGEGFVAVDFETTPLPSERERRVDLSRRVAEAKGKIQAATARHAAARRGAGDTAAATTALVIRRSWRRWRALQTTRSAPGSIRTARRRGCARSMAAAPASP
jgi:hypothetical protein